MDIPVIQIGFASLGAGITYNTDTKVWSYRVCAGLYVAEGVIERA